MTATIERPRVDEPESGPAVRVGGRRAPRFSLAVVALLITALSALGFMVWARSLGDRTEVLVATRAIASGSVIGRSDLAVARVAGDRGVRAVPATSLDRVVGRVAAGAIPRGSLVNPDAVSDAPTMNTDEAIVGVAVRSGQAPMMQLTPGLSVMVVRTPASSSVDGLPDVLARRAVIEAVTRPDRSDAAAAAFANAQFVTLRVSANAAPEIAAASAADRVRLVLVAPQ